PPPSAPPPGANQPAPLPPAPPPPSAPPPPQKTKTPRSRHSSQPLEPPRPATRSSKLRCKSPARKLPRGAPSPRNPAAPRRWSPRLKFHRRVALQPLRPRDIAARPPQKTSGNSHRPASANRPNLSTPAASLRFRKLPPANTSADPPAADNQTPTAQFASSVPSAAALATSEWPAAQTAQNTLAS